jgi:TolB-like protein
MLRHVSSHAARPRLLRAAILLSAAALTAATPAPLAQDLRESSFTTAAAEVAHKVAEAFPKLEGLVIRVDGDLLYLDLGEDQRAFPGMELSVSRPGQEFRNPYTGKVLGVLDREIASARIVEVRDKYSVARVVSRHGDLAVQEQDKVRMTGARLTVVLPVVDTGQVRTVNARALTREIQTALGKTGRFEVIDDRRLRSAGFPAKPAELAAPDTVKGLGARLHASALLMGRVVPAEQALRIEMEVLSTATARPMTLASADIRSRDPRMAIALGQKGPGGTLVTTTDFVVRDAGPAVVANVMRGPEFENEMRGLAVGNVFGDGRRTLVTTDGRRILAMAFDGTRYQRVWEGRIPPPGNGFAVDVADVNGDGRAEIFVTSYGGGRLSSFVLEFDGKEMRRVWDDVPLFFRSVPAANGRGVRVYAQRAALGGAFEGPVRPILWQDGRYVEGPPLELPAGVNLYRFTPAEGLPHEGSAILAYDPKSFLEVVDASGKVRYRSKESFGGAEIALEVRPGPGLPGGFFTNPRVYLGARIVPREGRAQFLVPKNFLTANWFLSGFGIYDRSKLYGLRWDGESLQTAWETKEVDGYIADYAVAPAGEDGTWEATLLLTRPALWGDGASRLITMLFKDPPSTPPDAAAAR